MICFHYVMNLIGFTHLNNTGELPLKADLRDLVTYLETRNNTANTFASFSVSSLSKIVKENAMAQQINFQQVWHDKCTYCIPLHHQCSVIKIVSSNFLFSPFAKFVALKNISMERNKT